jgi:hypothetical protein
MFDLSTYPLLPDRFRTDHKPLILPNKISNLFDLFYLSTFHKQQHRDMRALRPAGRWRAVGLRWRQSPAASALRAAVDRDL